MGDAEEISHATILIFAHHLGIDIDAEEQLMFIAKEALQQMPEGWELGVSPEGDENAGIPYFFKIESGESIWEHPQDEMYKERVKEERTKRAAAAAERKKAKLLKDGSPKGISGRKGSLVSERAGAFEKGVIKGDGIGEVSPLDTATAASVTNPIASTNAKVPLASAMAFVNSGGKINKNISPVKPQLQQSSKSEETTFSPSTTTTTTTTTAKVSETVAVATTTSVNTASTTITAPSVVVATTTTPDQSISLSTTTASTTATIAAAATTTNTAATTTMAPLAQPALVPVASTAAAQGLGKGPGLEPSAASSASTHIHPSAPAQATTTTTASYSQPTPTHIPSSSSISVQSLAASASTTPQYGLLSVVIDGAKLHSKYKPGYSVQCSIVVTNDNGGTIGDSSDLSNYTSNNNNNYTSGQSTNDRVLAIFKPAFTGSTKLHRYVQGKSQAKQGLGLASGQGKLALVSVQRETPVVALEPLSSTQEDSPQHPHHRTTLLADIASAGGKPLSRHHGYSSQCSWGEVVQIKCCAGWRLQLRVTLSPPPPPAGTATTNSDQVLLLLANPIVVGGESNSKWEEHPLKITTTASTSRGPTAFSSSNNDGLVEIWSEFVPLTRTLWRRGQGLGSAPGQGLGQRTVRAGASLLDVRKTLAEVEFEAYQDYEASLALLQGLIVDLQTSATPTSTGNQSSSSSPPSSTGGSGGTAHKGIWATVTPARIGSGPRQALMQAAKALEYLGSHSTEEDLGLTNRLLAILQPQHSRAMAVMTHVSGNANLNASSPSTPMPLPPSTVTLEAARSVLRTFVATTVSDLVVEAPALGRSSESHSTNTNTSSSSSSSSRENEALMEQLLSLFLSTQLTHPQTSSTSTSSTSSSSALPVATSLTWRQLMALCFTSAVWAMETACVAAALISDPQVGVGLTEFRAIRHKWWSLDHHLTGTLSSSELGSLLFAMGGVEYTPEEVRIALLELDPDDLKIVEFASFIRWWGLPLQQLQQQ